MKKRRKKSMSILEMNEKLRFSSPLEIEIHKQISKMGFGECLVLDLTTDFILKSGVDRRSLIKAIEKSAKYNCMTVRLHWSKARDFVKVTHEM
jgi:hypothetical protein